MSPELIAYLLSWAVFYTGYEMPARPPIIVYVTHQYFVDSPTCKGIDTYENPCSVRAAYNDLYTGIIELDEQFKDSTGYYAKGIVVHEIVHYLQDVSGRWNNMLELEGELLCQERAFRQREAYMAQDQYNEDVHGVKRLLPRFYDDCGNI